MNAFGFTEEQEAFRVELDRYARTRLLPAYRDRAAKAEFPWDAHKELARLGVLGIGLPEEFGGAGVSPEDPVTEPGSGSDAAGMRTVAEPVAGGWLLSGEKIAITHATCAATMLVYARHPGSTRAKGISCFLLPMDAPAVSVGHMPGMGCLPLGWGSIVMDSVFVPSENLVGEKGRGFAAAMHHFDFSRSALGLLCLGAPRASLEEAARYATEREAFGQKIAEFQGVSFPLAEHATYLEAARLLCFRALWARQAGQPHTALAAMSKWWPPRVALEAIQAAMQIHGNLGYSTEFPVPA